MASIITRASGIRFIQVFIDRQRHVIYLGKVSRRIADKVLTVVESLAIARSFNTFPEADVVDWLSGIGDQLYARIQKAGLIGARRSAPNPTLGEWIKTFLDDYPHRDTGTKETIDTGAKRLAGHFGESRTIASISVKDAKACRAALIGAGYAVATVGNTIKKARQIWAEAIKRGIVTENPWSEVETGAQDNPERAFYIDAKTTAAVLAACPDREWKLIVALCRFGGLRFPSEAMQLAREDLDWDKSRFKVKGKGKRDRVVPMFARLRPFLEACPKRKGPLVSDARRLVSGTALRWQFERILAKAGLEQWPRIFHNLRASCETDLDAEGFRPSVYSRWLGNSETVARKHYLQPTEEDFDRATAKPTRKTKRA